MQDSRADQAPRAEAARLEVRAKRARWIARAGLLTWVAALCAISWQVAAVVCGLLAFGEGAAELRRLEETQP